MAGESIVTVTVRVAAVLSAQELSARTASIAASPSSSRLLSRSTVSPQTSEYDSLSAPACHW
ncbi:hypothetical protein [Aeromicrobium sp. UC242_57]|uniref:hypothetical protein n=1 Tax=Aeromicrobium sp. UC242_57 TaxID=3374624 RepID=UPI00379695D8